MTQQPAKVHPLALIPRLLAAVALFGVCGGAQAQSLFFTSNFTPDDVGRVEIQVDGRPIDVGAGDFTLEFWMRASSGNSRGGVNCNTGDYSWINGNIVFDRDRQDSGARDFGLAIANGRIAFGVENSNGNYTICSDSTVLNDEWRHIAVQRRASDGMLWVHIDGILEQQEDGPNGDISYPDGQNAGTLQPVLTIGREKYGFDYGYTGWLDEIRISNVLRYQSSNFQVPTQPYVLDASTVALYHLDEGAGDVITDDNGLSNGERRFSAAAGPEWSTDTPFGASTSPGTLRFSVATYAANEGTPTRTITVTRAGGTAGPATVDLGVTGGSATSGADYQFTPSTLSWNAGQGGTRTSDITIVDDTITEGSETINLALSNATGASIGSPGTAVVTIAASDGTAPPAAGVLQFSAATYTVSEATSTLTITVTRTGGSSGAASVNVAVNGGTATASTDYQIPSAPLTWNDGNATSRTLNITVVNDTAVEGSETIALELSNVTGAGLGAVTSATATINDDDQSTPPSPAPRSSGGGGAADSLWILFGMSALLRHRNRRRSARNAGGFSVL